MIIQASIQIMKTDWLHKIRPLLDLSHEQFRKVCQLWKTVSVDESLVLFKGWLKFKQYIKTKRNWFGIKLHKLATSHRITLDLLVYSRKEMFGEGNSNSDMPATERIPSVLMEPFLGKGHVFCSDNFYTNLALAIILSLRLKKYSKFFVHGIHACLPLRGELWYSKL